MLVGSNPDEVDALAKQMARAADKIDLLHGDALSLIRGSAWAGPDAQHFEQNWRGEGRSRVQAAVSILRAASESAARNAADQRKASEAEGGAFTAAGTGAQMCSAPRADVALDKGVIRLGDPSDGEVATRGTAVDQSAPAGSPSDYMTKLGNLPPGTLQIVKVDGPPERYVVLLKGIDGIFPTENLTDSDAVLLERAGIQGPWAAAIKRAMEDQNIPPGAEVMLMGHSGGGIVALNLAGDSEFMRRYNVTDVVIAGSGVESGVNRIRPETNVLMLNHATDSVADGIRLLKHDPASTQSAGRHQINTFYSGNYNAPTAQVAGISGHDVYYYSDELKRLEGGDTGSARAGDVGYQQQKQMVQDMRTRFASSQSSTSTFYQLKDH